MTDRSVPSSGGALTGATGDLTPDEVQADFLPGEWKEASGADEQGDVTRAQAATAPAQLGIVGEPGEPSEEGGLTELSGRESGYGADAGLSSEDPVYRMEARPASPRIEEGTGPSDTRIGGDELSEREEHL